MDRCGPLHESHVDRYLIPSPGWASHLCLTVSVSSLCFWASTSGRLEFSRAETQAILGSWGRKVVMVEVMTLVMGEVMTVVIEGVEMIMYVIMIMEVRTDSAGGGGKVTVLAKWR